MASDNSSSVSWLKKHPVVSTVLWILGTDIKNSPKTESDDSRPNTLSWRDDHGGHIAEYIDHVQRKEANSNNPNTSVDSQGKQLVRSSNEKFAEGSPDSCSSPYGFYVRLTPPSDCSPENKARK